MEYCAVLQLHERIDLIQPVDAPFELINGGELKVRCVVYGSIYSSILTNAIRSTLDTTREVQVCCYDVPPYPWLLNRCPSSYNRTCTAAQFQQN